ncbi:hypothetical protein FCM35_KLT04909 [Carex littledalei]|uniref:Envelope protein n=1 Tax=Carex littledalei TaxID=544730 RepID=A0A833VNT2_9POAL|nr:hypothetical protein FCM35_KLT04909 [Carex littledalei]
MKLYKRPLILFLSLHYILSAFSCSAYTLHSAQGSGLGEEGSVLPVRTQWNLNLQIPERRSLTISESNSSYVLAAERTQRKDPLNGFKIYTGGWNISNEHYWASVGFSAAPIFAIAAGWIVIFGIILFFLVGCFCCCSGRNYSASYSRIAYACSLALLIAFTIAAILGCIVLYGGQEKFHKSITSTTNYILGQAHDTVSNLQIISNNLDAAKSVGVDQISLPSDLKMKIDRIVNRINASANELDSRTASNSHKIEYVINSMRMTLIIVAAAMLLLTFLGFLLSICGLQTLIYILVMVGWIFIAGTLILSGVFLLLHNIVSDTCLAMDEWVQQPQGHTALDDILPCVDPAMTTEAIDQSKLVTYQIINMVNGIITNVSNRDFPPQSIPLYYNQSGPLVPQLCSPYLADLSPRTCATEELNFNNAVQVWNGYVCETTSVSGSEICTTIGRLTPAFYHQMTISVNVTFGLYHYGPYLSDLADCSFVRKTFEYLSDTNCPGLGRYSTNVYVGLLVVSVAVMLSLIFWVVYARERRHMKNSKVLNG